MNKKWMKWIGVGCAMILAMGVMTGCQATEENNEENKGSTSISGEITILTREDSSGTRGAFIELFGIEQKNDEGKKVDLTTENAEITDSTAVMMTSVEGNKKAIGYTSLGALKNTVKAVKIDGVEATVDNIKNGTYKAARPFNIATKADLSELASDFMAYIMSEDGQKVIEDNGYISEGNTGAFTGGNASGKIVVAGSSSVTPAMEKLKEAYLRINTNATIDIQMNDSSAGISAAANGTCDIGMASRELKDTELAKGLTSTTIAMDGIAVIVNKENNIDNLTSEQVMNIYLGEITDWEDIQE